MFLRFAKCYDLRSYITDSQTRAQTQAHERTHIVHKRHLNNNYGMFANMRQRYLGQNDKTIEINNSIMFFKNYLMCLI